MSRHVTPFNRLEITSGTLNRIQDGKDELIIQRLVDAILQPGIAIPSGSNARDVENAFDATTTVPQFTITAVGADKVTVGPGVAYDEDGNRIELVSGDVTVFNPNAPLFTVTITGVSAIQPAAGPIPYSTGRVSAFDRGAGPPYTTPDTSDGERFVFVRYQEVVLTKATPSNHAAATQIATTIAIAGGDPDTKKPLTELDEKEGLVYAPHRVDGYEVVIVELAGLTVPSQGVPNTPVLAADTSAVYVGRYTLTAGIAGSVILNDTDRPRHLLRLRPREVGVVQSDPTKRPATYDLDQAKTLEEHVAALGTGVVSPTNPHGLAITDITGGGEEPLNTLYQSEVMGDGIIDPAVTRNAPIPTVSALAPNIVNTPAMGFNAYVQFSVAAGKAVYIAGHRVDVTDILGNGPVVVNQVTMGFTAETTGTYVLYLHLDTIAVSTTLEKASTLPANTATNFYFPLVTVFWNGTTTILKQQFRNSAVDLPAGSGGAAVETPPLPVEARRFGLVTPRQLATDAISNPDAGFFANEIFTNRLHNSAFYDRWGGVVNSFLQATTFSAPFLTANQPHGWDKIDFTTDPGITLGTIPTMAVIDGTTDPLLRTTGPKLDAALKLTFVAGAGPNLDVRIRGKVSDLKPDTTYLVTGWIKLTSPGAIGTAVPTTINVLGGFVDSTGTFRATAYQTMPFVNNTTAYQRISALVKTTSLVDVLNDHRLELRFATQSFAPIQLADIYLADWSVTEGEWFVKSENMRPQGYQLRGFLNPGGGVNNVGGNPGGGVWTIMDIVVPSRGQQVSIQAGVSIRNGQNAPPENVLSSVYLEIDGVQVSNTFALLDNIADITTMYHITVPFRPTFAGHFTPGVHHVKLQWQTQSTNLFVGGVEPFFGGGPEMSLLLL
jgi:hypothetical protein